MSVDRDTFLETMSNVAATVTVVTTTSEDGVDAGLTVSAFSSVSLDPPLVLVCIGKESNSLESLLANGGYTVNFLKAGAHDIATKMALSSDAKMDDLALRPTSQRGAGPVLVDAAFAHFACTTRNVIEAGDHWILVGEVMDGSIDPEGGSPLVYYRRAFVDVSFEGEPL